MIYYTNVYAIRRVKSIKIDLMSTDTSVTPSFLVKSLFCVISKSSVFVAVFFYSYVM